MTIKEFIEAAIEGGWKSKLFPTLKYTKGIAESLRISGGIEHIVLDPEAWKAVTKVKGWTKVTSRVCICGRCLVPENQEATIVWEDQIAEYHMLRMINALFNGKTLEEYIATL